MLKVHGAWVYSVPRFQVRRHLSTKWKLQFKDEWQQRKQNDSLLSNSLHQIESSVPAKLYRRIDAGIDNAFKITDSSVFRLIPIRLRSLSSQARVPDDQFRPLETLFWSSPFGRFLYPKDCSVPYWHLQKDWTQTFRDRSVDSLVVLSLPLYKFWFRNLRQNLKKSILWLGSLNETNRLLELLRRQTGLYLDFNCLLYEFEHSFLPRLLTAVNNDKDPVWDSFLKSHCTESAMSALKATKNPSAGMSFDMKLETPKDSRFVSIVKVDWKGSFCPKPITDKGVGLLMFLVTLREVSDQIPREAVLSMAVAVEKDAPQSIKYRVSEVVLLSSETFLL
eukprot:Gregarina_sp_Poly_1__4863@NODE_258_length_10499_cov_54_071223_g225_i0_p4_GENE_NODE_258_length_10499_cov_54_071223_g225_i0NODE_258_length_10499_cov_54_071223_g225_i0_p4_ORF_typecomplete_len335_score42_55_NODE_258_length_10499_cov_54_071223_g225_i042665270